MKGPSWHGALHGVDAFWQQGGDRVAPPPADRKCTDIEIAPGRESEQRTGAEVANPG
jgi:hypothetical protein